MPLDFQTVDVRFTQGLDTKTQPKLVIPGKWNQLQNCRLDEDNTPQRRDGIVALAAAATGNGLATYNKELLVVNGQTLSSVTTAQTDAVVARTGELGYVGVGKDEVYRSTALVDAMDTAVGNGFSCHAWREWSQPTVQLGVKYSLIDETTGTKVFSEVLIGPVGSALCPRVVFSSDAFFIFWIDEGGGGGSRLWSAVIRVSGTPTQGTPVALITSANLGLKNFDAVSCDTFALGSPLAMVAYPWNDGTTSVRNIGVTHAAGVPAISLGPTNVIAEATATYASLTAIACALFSATRAGTFAMSTGATGLVGRVTDPTWANVAGPTGLDGAVVVRAGMSHLTAMVDANARMHLFYDQRAYQGTAGFEPVRTVTVDATLAITTAAATLLSSASFDVNAARASGVNGPWIGGKAFRVGTAFYLPMYMQSNHSSLGANTRTLNEQCTFFLMDAITGVVLAKALYSSFSPDGITALGSLIPNNATSTPCSSATLSSGVFSLLAAERTRIVFEDTAGVLGSSRGAVNASQAGVVRLTLTPNTSLPPIRAQLGESVYFSGGSVSGYDGTGVTEAGFPMFPEGISVVAVGAGGAMTAGVHQVVAIYEWVDGAGNLCQSTPSLAVSVTTVLNDSLTVIVPTLLVSQKAGVNLVIYMTQAGGLTFNRVSSITAPTPNVTSAATVTITVVAADATIAGAGLLYTQPNVAGATLPAFAPGPASAMGLHQNRVFMDKTDSPGVFQYSQPLVANVGIQFNPDLTGRIDLASGGAIVGFATMDEKLIIFGARKPYVLYGAGPNSSGGFSGYGEPQEISSDVGCSEARSILKMPQGIIFKSAKGWYLLSRDLQTRYIGEGVAAFDGNSVSGAVLLEDRQECRFSSTSGTQLIYAYDNQGGQWSTTVYRADSGAAVTNVAVADAVYWSTGGYYATVSLVHGLNRDTPGVFLDQPGSSPSAVAIPTTARTAWLRMAIINGFQRVRWMYLTGTAPTAPTSTLTITVDFDDAYGFIAAGSYQFTVSYATMFPTFVVGTSVDFRHKLIRQKCKSVAFTFTDTPTVANPGGVNFQAMSLELGMKKGLKKLPAAQSV